MPNLSSLCIIGKLNYVYSKTKNTGRTKFVQHTDVLFTTVCFFNVQTRLMSKNKSVCPVIEIILKSI